MAIKELPETLWNAVGEFLKDKTSRKFMLTLAFVVGAGYLVYSGNEVPRDLLAVTGVVVVIYLVVNVVEKWGDKE